MLLNLCSTEHRTLFCAGCFVFCGLFVPFHKEKPLRQNVRSAFQASDNRSHPEEFKLHGVRQQVDSLQRKVCVFGELFQRNRSDPDLRGAARRGPAPRGGSPASERPIYPGSVRVPERSASPWQQKTRELYDIVAAYCLANTRYIL